METNKTEKNETETSKVLRARTSVSKVMPRNFRKLWKMYVGSSL